MKRLDLKNEIASRIGDENFVLASEKQVERWLDLAVRTVWKAWPWSFARKQATENTVAGTATVDLDSDVQRVSKVVITSEDVVLVYAPERWLLNHYPDGEQGEPRYYTDGGLKQDTPFTSPPIRKLKLYPTPDRVYTLQVTFLATPRALADDDEYPPVPEDFDEALINWCLVRYYRKVDDFQSAAECQATYDAEVGRLVTVYGHYQTDEFAHIYPDDDTDMAL